MVPVRGRPKKLRSAPAAASVGKENLAEAIRRRFAEFGGIELSLPKRTAIRSVRKHTT